jgi:Kef-type K+ transport system membrane component KefB/mannitol/fructose-specific phosphotransferase system IIA component
MDTLTHNEITALFLALGLLLASARLLGEVALRFNLPAVLGEILAGILWGPTLFGALAPDWHAFLFPGQGGGALAFEGLTTLAIALFLLVAGMEVDLSTVWRQGRAALNIGIAGIVAPFALGFAASWVLPSLLGMEAGANRLIFALFMATALSISALPVIAKTLMDLNLYRSDLGMLVVAAAVLNDLVGWIIFAVILGMLGTDPAALGIGQTIWLTLGFALVVLTVFRWAFNRALPWIQAHTSWPGGVLGLALSLALMAAAFTEWIGIHAIFGTFLVGVALGDSRHLRMRTRATIEQFVSFIFAPLFFASIGLKVNFLANFDLLLVLIVLVIAIVGKVVGCGLASRLSGLSRRESLAVGFGLNARGAMEIILGLLALQNGLISERLFVALVVMALATSLMSGPFLQRLLHLKKPLGFTDFLSSKSFIQSLSAFSRTEAIEELARAAAEDALLDPATVTRSVLAREALMSTGIGKGLAVPHARLPGLVKPVVAVGLSRPGIDFDSPDDTAAHVICLILTPVLDDGAQLEILADIATTFKAREIRNKVLGVAGFTEFLALVRSGQAR